MIESRGSAMTATERFTTSMLQMISKIYQLMPLVHMSIV